MKQRAKKTIQIPIAAIVVCFAIALAITSCRWSQNTSPSVIVIAVDQLGVNQVNCSSDNPTQDRSGIALLCQESIRFTHAYTTSVLSGPALTSLLTGKYPFQHGLRSNAKSFLSARVTTLAEIYLRNGYATAFFSGGPPILRKLNLQQGFETFDDVYTPTPNQLFRPFLRTQKLFEAWLKDIKSQSFFSVLYVPDLNFTDTTTQTDLGATRDLSFESQLEEFDESLFTFIQSLKSRQMWDSTMIVLVGLNGPDLSERPTELSNTNLFSERTQVGLLIKPPQKPRDEGIHWGYDGNMTLADIGYTLMERFIKPETDPDFPLLSLAEILKSPSNETQVPERWVLTESFWSETSQPRMSARWGQYLFILDETPKVFNSFIDKLETTSLRLSESTVREKWESIQSFLERKRWQLWPELSNEFFLKWKNPAPENLERLAHRLREDRSLTQQYSRALLQEQNWEQLQRWSQGIKDRDLEIVALRNLKKEVRAKFTDPCLATLQILNPQPGDLKHCTHGTALSLLEWYLFERTENSDQEKENSRKKFLRLYHIYRMDQTIVETNRALSAIWELSQELRQRPLTLEMMLALPEMAKYRQAAVKSYQQFSQEPSVAY